MSPLVAFVLGVIAAYAVLLLGLFVLMCVVPAGMWLGDMNLDTSGEPYPPPMYPPEFFQ